MPNWIDELIHQFILAQFLKQRKKVCTTLDYIEHLVILDFAVNGCASMSSFASLVGIPIRITCWNNMMK